MKPDQTTGFQGFRRSRVDHGRDRVGGVVKAIDKLKSESKARQRKSSASVLTPMEPSRKPIQRPFPFFALMIFCASQCFPKEIQARERAFSH